LHDLEESGWQTRPDLLKRVDLAVADREQNGELASAGRSISASTVAKLKRSAR
jgi:hypothetical protein